MLYKPKYCCNCGERVERIEWKISSSRRFCEFCETEFKFEEILPRVIIIFLIVFGFWGFGSLFLEQKPRVIISKKETGKTFQNSSASSLKNKVFQNKSGNSGKGRLTDQDSQAIIKRKKTGNPATQKGNLDEEIFPETKSLKDGQKNIKKTVYFCGAETKKGNPCIRKVKGGGRCWQHRKVDKVIE